MRKPRSDAKLLNLPEDQKAKLADWLIGGMPYHQAIEVVKKEFGVEAGRDAFQNFWQSECAPRYLARRSQGANMAREIAQEAARIPGQFQQATIDAIEQKAFELSINPLSEPKEVKNLFMLIQKGRDQDIKVRQLDLDREKFQFDAAKACLAKLPELKAIAGNNTLDQDAKLRAMRQTLFGVLPE